MRYPRSQMSLKNCPKLLSFMNTRIADGSPDQDTEVVRQFALSSGEAEIQVLLGEIRDLLASGLPDLTDFGTEANRWFAETEEAVSWLGMLASTLESASAQNDQRVALDCNGAPLNEDDCVTVIKDLKVKGGSSDLKRGTLIRKIRLTPDPKLIECRVDGSVLVLKTEFLKKA